jgi:hypothetical protein
MRLKQIIETEGHRDMTARQIIKNDVVEILSNGARITLASVKKSGAEWKITMPNMTESGAPKYEFTATRREAIDRLRFVYNAA